MTLITKWAWLLAPVIMSLWFAVPGLRMMGMAPASAPHPFRFHVGSLKIPWLGRKATT
jgi:hypothetical protein